MFRFLARLLGVTPSSVPQQSFDGVANGVSYSVKSVSRETATVSIHLGRCHLQEPPTKFINSDKNEDFFCRSGRIGGLVHCIFRLGASSVDVGTSSDAIVAVFSTFLRVVDASIAEQAVNFMAQLRTEVTDEQPVLSLRTPPDLPSTTASLEVDGRMIQFEIWPCLIDADEDDGTFGNLQVAIRTDTQMTQDFLFEHVRLALPDYDEHLVASGYGSIDRGVELGFALLELAASLGYAADDRRQAWLWKMVTTLKEVDVVWTTGRNIPLATIPCFRKNAPQANPLAETS